MEHTAVCLRAYLTSEQSKIFEQMAGNKNFIYNKCLELKKEEYKRWVELGKPKKFSWLSPFDIQKNHLPIWRKEHEFLSLSSAGSLIRATQDLGKSVTRFLSGVSSYPKWKTKKSKRSVYFTSTEVKQDRHLETSGNQLFIQLPKGLGQVKCKLHRELPECKLVSVTLSRKANQYHISLLYEVPEGYSLRRSDQQRLPKCGIDLGVVKPLTVAYLNSQGEEKHRIFGVEERRRLIELERRRRKHSRVSSRRQLAYNKRCKSEVRKCQKTGKDYTPPSRKNLDKANLRVQKDYLNESNYRKDFGHKLSSLLASKFEVIKFEDLKLSNMTKQVRKNEDSSSRKGVAAKSSLNREMLRIGLGFIIKETEHKSKLYGGTTKFVNPRFTSQRCHVCGHISKDNRKSQAVFQCTSCGFTQNADVNAAFNIASRKPL